MGRRCFVVQSVGFVAQKRYFAMQRMRNCKLQVTRLVGVVRKMIFCAEKLLRGGCGGCSCWCVGDIGSPVLCEVCCE